MDKKRLNRLQQGKTGWEQEYNENIQALEDGTADIGFVPGAGGHTEEIGVNRVVIPSNGDASDWTAEHTGQIPESTGGYYKNGVVFGSAKLFDGNGAGLTTFAAKAKYYGSDGVEQEVLSETAILLDAYARLKNPKPLTTDVVDENGETQYYSRAYYNVTANKMVVETNIPDVKENRVRKLRSGESWTSGRMSAPRASNGSAISVYVDPEDGDDANGTGELKYPVKTFAKAMVLAGHAIGTGGQTHIYIKSGSTMTLASNMVFYGSGQYLLISTYDPSTGADNSTTGPRATIKHPASMTGMFFYFFSRVLIRNVIITSSGTGTAASIVSNCSNLELSQNVTINCALGSSGVVVTGGQAFLQEPTVLINGARYAVSASNGAVVSCYNIGGVGNEYVFRSVGSIIIAAAVSAAYTVARDMKSNNGQIFG